MDNLNLIDFQIFPSQYEQDKNGYRCCWLGGRDPEKNVEVTLQPYQTDAIDGYTNPDWGFHLRSTGKPDQYYLKYVKMSAPLDYWYGVAVGGGKLVLKKWTEDTVFIIKGIGEYYTLEYGGKHAECEDGYLGKNTSIDLWNIAPPTPEQVKVYDNIPAVSFRILWKFIKMDHMSGRDWVTKLRATKRKEVTLDRLFIPGTHDSGTEKNTQFNQTQFLTIPEQAAIGVRYFDLRVADNWQIYHGSDSDIDLKYVVDSVLDHLKNNPEEFFFLQISAQTPEGFSDRLYDYLEDNCVSVFSRVYMPDTIPTLENTVGGKIFFFARYEPADHSKKTHSFKEHRIQWTDNTGGSEATYNPFTDRKVYVQDCYKFVGDSSKLNNYIIPTLYDKMFNKAAGWTINFTSVANKWPIHSAEYLNPLVANLLMWTAPEPCGLLMIDDARQANVANIIALNFK